MSEEIDFALLDQAVEDFSRGAEVFAGLWVEHPDYQHQVLPNEGVDSKTVQKAIRQLLAAARRLLDAVERMPPRIRQALEQVPPPVGLTLVYYLPWPLPERAREVIKFAQTWLPKLREPGFWPKAWEHDFFAHVKDFLSIAWDALPETRRRYEQLKEQVEDDVLLDQAAAWLGSDKPRQEEHFDHLVEAAGALAEWAKRQGLEIWHLRAENPPHGLVVMYEAPPGLATSQLVSARALPAEYGEVVSDAFQRGDDLRSIARRIYLHLVDWTLWFRTNRPELLSEFLTHANRIITAVTVWLDEGQDGPVCLLTSETAARIEEFSYRAEFVQRQAERISAHVEAGSKDSAPLSQPPAGRQGSERGARNDSESDSTNKYEKLDTLKPHIQKAYLAYLYAEAKNERRLEDREAWEWLRENGISEDDEQGQLADYEPPEFATFARYLRKARKALGELKYTRRTARPTGRSVVSSRDIEVQRRNGD